MNKKIKLFLDYDNCVTNSIKIFCSVYNEIYATRPNFKPANWQEVERWDLKDVAPLVPHCNDIFSCERFFEKLEFINENTYEILERLSNKYQIIITSIGTPKNLALKAIWLQNKLPFIKNYILIKNGNNEMSKALVNMQNSIFIDDVESNLTTSNAKTKICFGNIYPWNWDWCGDRCYNWSEVENFLT